MLASMKLVTCGFDYEDIREREPVRLLTLLFHPQCLSLKQDHRISTMRFNNPMITTCPTETETRNHVIGDCVD